MNMQTYIEKPPATPQCLCNASSSPEWHEAQRYLMRAKQQPARCQRGYRGHAIIMEGECKAHQRGMQWDEGHAAGHATCKAHAWDIDRGMQGSRATSFSSYPCHGKWHSEGSCSGWPVGGRAGQSLTDATREMNLGQRCSYSLCHWAGCPWRRVYTQLAFLLFYHMQKPILQYSFDISDFDTSAYLS